jgi:hypothetical protein
MEFGPEKCSKITFKIGKPIPFKYLVIDISREIQELEQGRTYKYSVFWKFPLSPPDVPTSYATREIQVARGGT